MTHSFYILKILGLWAFVGILTSSHTSVPTQTETENNLQHDSLNISYPEFLEKPILAAYSRYTDLQNSQIHIFFELRDKISKSIMQAQPVVSSLFSDKGRREYRIKISRFINLNDTTYAIEDMPTEILTGWFAHEIGHIRDYFDRSNLAMVWFGLRYVTSDKFLREAEWRADKYAVDAGLVEELVLMRNFISPDNGFEQPYCDRIGMLYPNCDNILNYYHENQPSADYEPAEQLLEQAVEQ